MSDSEEHLIAINRTRAEAAQDRAVALERRTIRSVESRRRILQGEIKSALRRQTKLEAKIERLRKELRELPNEETL